MIITKKNLNNFFKVFLGLLSGIILFEIFLRTIENTYLWRIFPVIEPILGVPDKNIGYKFTPNQKGIWAKENRVKVKINSLGLRDISYGMILKFLQNCFNWRFYS